MSTLKKILRLGHAYTKSKFHPLPLWVHMWVTDRCDLACSYCEIVENTKNPSTERIESWIAHADTLGTAIIAFMGGEPTLRSDMTQIIRYASERNITTYLTSHAQGRVLSEEKLVEFGKAGLDLLEISLDGYDTVEGSEKTLQGDESLIERLEIAAKEYGLRYKAHQVLSPSTLDETPKLIELAQRRKIPITFGLVTEFAAFNNKNDERNSMNNQSSVYETPQIKQRMRETLQFLITKKEEGAPILNPITYFEEALSFLDHPIRWNCDIGTYMLQVATTGEIFLCSKYFKRSTGVRFLDISLNYFKEDQHHSKALLDKCNDKCFSACAYTTSHFRRHPGELLGNVLRYGK